jgi:GDPmannose 4,6-dehydratase
MSRALICGITGQDGSYLAKFLVDKGYEVWGTSRDAQTATLRNLRELGVVDRVNMISMAPNDFRSVISALKKSDPIEIYFLAGQSSVGLSFEQPAETLESITGGTLNLLEACRFLEKDVRIYHASSSECFGDLGGQAATEDAPFHPRSPYAVAKASAHWLVDNYREAYGLYACSGILFNHESPLRPARFVTKKIIVSAARIAAGSNEKLRMGRLDVVRDWGWAPEYVEAMWMMLQQPGPGNFIIATGESNSLEQFVRTAFESVDRHWRDHVEIDPALCRPTDLEISRATPELAARELGWRAKSRMGDVIQNMMQWELDRQ